MFKFLLILQKERPDELRAGNVRLFDVPTFLERGGRRSAVGPTTAIRDKNCDARQKRILAAAGYSTMQLRHVSSPAIPQNCRFCLHA